MVAGDRENRRRVMGVRFVELRIVFVVHAGEVHDIADVIAELWHRPLAGGQAVDHALGNMPLKFSVLNAASVADDVKYHLAGLLDLVTDRGEILYEIIVVGRQAEWTRQRLEARVAVGQRVESSHARVGLRLPLYGTRFDGAPVPLLSRLIIFDHNRTFGHCLPSLSTVMKFSEE